MNINRKRITAALLTALILFIILLTACAVVMEAAHDCSGENCDICRMLDAIIGVVRSLTFTAVLLSAVIIADTLRLLSRFTDQTYQRCATPVTEKVRLLN